MRNFVQPGKALTFTAPADVTSGDLVFVGAAFGVAAETAANGTPVDLWTEGVFTLPKTVADVMPAGVLVYWNGTTKAVTVTASGNTKIGIAAMATGADTGTVAVRLNGAF